MSKESRTTLVQIATSDLLVVVSLLVAVMPLKGSAYTIRESCLTIQ